MKILFKLVSIVFWPLTTLSSHQKASAYEYNISDRSIENQTPINKYSFRNSLSNDTKTSTPELITRQNFSASQNIQKLTVKQSLTTNYLKNTPIKNKMVNDQEENITTFVKIFDSDTEPLVLYPFKKHELKTERTKLLKKQETPMTKKIPETKSSIFSCCFEQE